MKKIYVDLTEDQVSKLRLLAGLERQSASSFIRALVVQILQEKERLLSSIENLKNGVIDNGRNE